MGPSNRDGEIEVNMKVPRPVICQAQATPVVVLTLAWALLDDYRLLVDDDSARHWVRYEEIRFQVHWTYTNCILNDKADGPVTCLTTFHFIKEGKTFLQLNVMERCSKIKISANYRTDNTVTIYQTFSSLYGLKNQIKQK